MQNTDFHDVYELIPSDEGAILLPSAPSCSHAKAVLLNPPALLVAELSSEGARFEEICSALASKYEISSDTADKEVKECLSLLDKVFCYEE